MTKVVLHSGVHGHMIPVEALHLFSSIESKGFSIEQELCEISTQLGRYLGVRFYVAVDSDEDAVAFKLRHM